MLAGWDWDLNLFALSVMDSSISESKYEIILINLVSNWPLQFTIEKGCGAFSTEPHGQVDCCTLTSKQWN